MAKRKLASLLKAKSRAASGQGRRDTHTHAQPHEGAQRPSRPADASHVVSKRHATNPQSSIGHSHGRRRIGPEERARETAAASALEVSMSDAMASSAAASSAYASLVGSLSERSDALKQRRLEEQGRSSESESGGSDGEDVGFEDESDAEDEPSAQEDAAEDGASSDSDTPAAGDGEEDGEHGAMAMAATDTWTLLGMRTAAATGAAPEPAPSHVAASSAGADDGAGVPDPWAAHMEHELSREQLEAGGAHAPSVGRRPLDAEEGSNLAALSDGSYRWQVCGRPAVPSAPATLAAAGVKERLRARWVAVGAGTPGAAESDRVGETDMHATAGTSGSGGHEGVRGITRKIRSARKGTSAGASSEAVAMPPGEFASRRQRAFFGAMASYSDVLVGCRAYPTSDADAPPGSELRARDEYMDAYLLHALNHVVKTADRIKKVRARTAVDNDVRAALAGPATPWILIRRVFRGLNNDRLEAARDKDKAHARAAALERVAATEGQTQRAKTTGARRRGKAKKPASAEGGGDEEGGGARPTDAAGAEADGEEAVMPRDQGFTRAKVLLLLPQRNMAFQAVRRLVQLAMRETRADSVQGKEKFVEQFGPPEAEEPADEQDAKARARRAAKPSQWRALFSGNADDHFRLGLKITRGSIRLFSDVFQSDIIVASPLAIATRLAEDAAAHGGKPSADSDFLSSIELLIIDRADVLSMQNWQHVETVVDSLGRLPREQHGVDIMRVREWYLSGHARQYRQTVLLTSFVSPPMTRLMGPSGCANHAGSVRCMPVHHGVLTAVIPQVQQLFERFAAANPTTVAAARFEFFKRSVWPRMREAGSSGQLLFTPSYFDFVRLRNFLTSEGADFCTVCEYTPPPDVTAARSRFFHGHRRLMLYTERAHFYHRHRIRGIRDVMFYSLPDHSDFYPELLNLLEADGLPGGGTATASATGSTVHATVSALFCRFDLPQLERVVGTARAHKMLSGDSATYMFC